MTDRSQVHPSEVPPTVWRVVPIWWAYLWRYILAVLGSFVVAAGVGLVLGVWIGLQGYTIEQARPALYAVGFAISLLTPIVPLRLIIGRKYGRYRLILVRDTALSMEAARETLGRSVP